MTTLHIKRRLPHPSQPNVTRVIDIEVRELVAAVSISDDESVFATPWSLKTSVLIPWQDVASPEGVWSVAEQLKAEPVAVFRVVAEMLAQISQNLEVYLAAKDVSQ